MIKHAKDCVLDDKLYMYRSSEDAIGLLLDSVLTVVGATFDGQNYLPLDKLSVYQMVCTSYHIFTSFLVIYSYILMILLRSIIVVVMLGAQN